MGLRGRFPVAGLPLVNSVLRFARQFVALSMLSRSHDQSCAENARFRKTVHRVEFFSCKRWLVRDLSEFTQQDGKMLVCDKPGRVITYVFCCDLHFKGKWSLAKSYFKRKLLLRLSQKVCGLLTSPVLLCKFTLKIRGRRRQVKRRFKSEFAVFQSSSRLFRRCLFKVHDVTRDATTIFSATQGSNAGTTLQPFETTSQQCFIAVRVALKIVVANRPMQHHLYVLYKTWN